MPLYVTLIAPMLVTVISRRPSRGYYNFCMYYLAASVVVATFEYLIVVVALRWFGKPCELHDGFISTFIRTKANA